MEVINSYYNHKKFINRGFLIGPYCPIYGFGVLFIINFLKDYMDKPLVLFILSMVICMLLEYITSYLMEKIFNARWWDYSNKKYNINGRICLEFGGVFGLGGLIIMYVLNPLVLGILNSLSNTVVYILGIILFVIFMIDIVISFSVIFKFRNIDMLKSKIKSVDKDSTEDMNIRIKEYLMEKSILTKRLVNAFPNYRIRIEKLKKKIEEYKKGN